MVKKREPLRVREMLEEIEARTLHPRACLSSRSRGRARPEPPDEIRPSFQRDRDRILHCKAFRRLAGKTQVFLAPEGDHYRTRITHTLEVAQIARTIAKALRLNETLAEAVAMAHDLGHPPFGHAGETALDRMVPGGFSHYRQSLRVVDKLENDGRGLNLTHEVRDGIVKHSKGEGQILPEDPRKRASTLEGQAVRVADIFAYSTADLDDAFRAGLLRPSDDIVDAHRRRPVGPPRFRQQRLRRIEPGDTAAAPRSRAPAGRSRCRDRERAAPEGRPPAWRADRTAAGESPGGAPHSPRRLCRNRS